MMPAMATTTAHAARRAIYREGLKFVAAGANPIGIQRGIQKPWRRRWSISIRSPKKVRDKEEINTGRHRGRPIGTVPSRIIRDAMEKVGRTAPLPLKKAKSIETTLEVVEGINSTKGIFRHYFVTMRRPMEAKLEELTY